MPFSAASWRSRTCAHWLAWGSSRISFQVELKKLPFPFCYFSVYILFIYLFSYTNNTSRYTSSSCHFLLYFPNIPALMLKKKTFSFYEKENVLIKKYQQILHKLCWMILDFLHNGALASYTYCLLLTHMLRIIDLWKALYNSLTVLRSTKHKKTAKA